jgi:hypothetical protein
VHSEDAVEFNELEIFLRQNEEYKPFEDDPEPKPQEAIGVPGAYSPLQMFPKHAPSRSPSPSPLKLREKEKSEINAGDTLAEFGLANVSVSIDELKALVSELGLGGDDATDLVKGLAGGANSPPAEVKTPKTPVKELKKLYNSPGAEATTSRLTSPPASPQPKSTASFPKPTTGPITKPIAKVDTQPDVKRERNIHAQVEPKEQAKTNAKADAKEDTKPDTEPDIMKVRLVVQPDPMPAAEPELELAMVDERPASSDFYASPPVIQVARPSTGRDAS